ncbi:MULTISPECIES: endolytic transglycosylase MltG [Gracilibacillus]|uniref:endolytic transglycosylase MltG n=1 Tax=Gracilibacillus TaxID=74385 RepID=UPI000AA650F6|nr:MULTISPECIES: endolytic transglycosylase MltG [Gracilibacillus]
MSKKKEKRQKTTYKEIAENRAKEITVARKIIAIVLIALVILMIIGGYSAYKFIQTATTPVDPSSDETVELTIPLGASSSDIANQLEEEGLIANSLVYRFYVKFNNISDFQAGDYTLSPSMTLKEISDELETGTLQQEAAMRVTIPEGRNIEEIATIFEEEAGIERNEFLNRMQETSYIETLINEYSAFLSEEILAEEIIYPLEGYLFPATYEFYHENPTVDEVVRQMLDKTNEVMAAYQSQIEESDYSPHEIITFASLVEEEAPSNDDRRNIAAVFYNRMNDGMRLQTDPTVIYAHGEHIPRLTYDDYEIESPYNTYQIDGLPIGPIANFGESSLSAVLDPANNNYLFFLADTDGNVHYAQTYEEHQQLEEQYIHNQD